MLTKIEEVAHKEEDLEIAKLELAVAAMKLELLRGSVSSVDGETVTTDPYAEKQMVEDVTESSSDTGFVPKSAGEIQAEIDNIMNQLEKLSVN